jgi:hypothetical protein
VAGFIGEPRLYTYLSGRARLRSITDAPAASKSTKYSKRPNCASGQMTR